MKTKEFNTGKGGQTCLTAALPVRFYFNAL